MINLAEMVLRHTKRQQTAIIRKFLESTPQDRGFVLFPLEILSNILFFVGSVTKPYSIV